MGDLFKLIWTLVKFTYRATRRLLGAATAAVVSAVLLLIVLIAARNQVLPFDNVLMRLAFGTLYLLIGTLTMAIAGFLWPTPWLVVLRLIKYLPDPPAREH